MTTTRTRLSAGLALILLSLAVAVSPAAKADAVDNLFVTAVKNKGIEFANPQAAIVAGHEVCDELDIGKQKSDIASEVMTNSNLDGYRAGFFIGASIAAYCPRYRRQASAHEMASTAVESRDLNSCGMGMYPLSARPSWPAPMVLRRNAFTAAPTCGSGYFEHTTS
jgi:hypothetical protein